MYAARVSCKASPDRQAAAPRCARRKRVSVAIGRRFHSTTLTGDNDFKHMLLSAGAMGIQEAHENSGNAVEGTDVIREFADICESKKYAVVLFRRDSGW